MEIQGELSYRDGGKRKFVVPCDNSCKGLIEGVEQLKAQVADVLTELVLQEKAGAGDKCFEGDEDDDDDDDDEDINDTSKNAFSTEPPSKRKKTKNS